ncbi:MAG: hypothetical protein ACREXY_03685 [Gammaproteobacteria bacterium]
MADDTTQRAAFAFLREHLQTQDPFTLDEFRAATGWKKPGTLNPYLSKHYKGLIEPVSGTHYRVTDAFWKLITWRKFKGHVTQVRRVVTNYEPKRSKVLIYDFLMPLTNEEHLRMTLDSLFYKDRVRARLGTIGVAELAKKYPRQEAESEAIYFDRLLDFIKGHFVGYSIYHVDGRFRSDRLLTQDQAAALQKTGERYLIDETTAVTRFIFPYLDDQELSAIQHLFQVLFVRSIIQLVNGEEQIWMVQSGSAGNQLHIWEKLSEDAGEEEEMTCRQWLLENGYEDVAALIDQALAKIQSKGRKSRRNWWDTLAGGPGGKPSVREGIEFPVLRVAQYRQGILVTPNAICRDEHERPPDVVTTNRWPQKKPSSRTKRSSQPASRKVSQQAKTT